MAEANKSNRGRKPIDRIKAAISLVTKPMKSVDPDAIDVNAVSVKSNDQGIAPNLPGLVKVFENAPEAEGLFSSYFGINLSNLAGMSPEELGAQTDIILQAKQFAEYIPIIEQHINDYIKAVTDYNTFISRSIKAGCKGIKEIDKAKLDVLLEWMGYKAHTEQLGRKSDNEKTKIENETENYIRLSDFNLEMALKMRAAALNNSIAQAQQRPILSAEQAQQRQIISDRKVHIKELIQYGTRGK